MDLSVREKYLQVEKNNERSRRICLFYHEGKVSEGTHPVASKLGGEDDDIMNPLLGVLTS